MAGVPGFEPGLTVLETAVLAVDTIPLYLTLFGLFVRSMNPALRAKLFELKTVGRLLLIFCCHVIAIFALLTNQCNVISWHNTSTNNRRHQKTISIPN